MSDGKKKEIHVKDLVIKAENVVFERPQREFDPFFGPRRRRDEDIRGEEDPKMDVDHEKDQEDEEGPDKRDDENRRPPFFWI